MPPWDQIIGPNGALVLAVAGIVGIVRVVVILWNNHVKTDRERVDYLWQTIAYERAEKEQAHARLDAFRETMKEANSVTERAVALAEGLSNRRRGTD